MHFLCFHAMLTLHCNISGHNSVHRVQSTAYIRAQYSAIGMYCNNEQRLIGSEKIRLWMHCNLIIASLCEKGLEVQQKTVQRKTDKYHIADGGIGSCDWQVDAIQKSTRQHYHPPHIQFPWRGPRMFDGRDWWNWTADLIVWTRMPLWGELCTFLAFASFEQLPSQSKKKMRGGLSVLCAGSIRNFLKIFRRPEKI